MQSFRHRRRYSPSKRRRAARTKAGSTRDASPTPAVPVSVTRSGRKVTAIGDPLTRVGCCVVPVTPEVTRVSILLTAVRNAMTAISAASTAVSAKMEAVTGAGAAVTAALTPVIRALTPAVPELTPLARARTANKEKAASLRPRGDSGQRRPVMRSLLPSCGERPGGRSGCRVPCAAWSGPPCDR